MAMAGVFIAAAVLVVVSPTSLLAFGDIAAFTFVGVDRTTVNEGQPVTFTARTVNAITLFATVNGDTVVGTVQDIDHMTGHATWSLTVIPVQSQTVVVHANNINAFDGAATASFPINVQGGVQGGGTGVVQPGVPVPLPQPTGHQIFDIQETPAPGPDTVTLTIVTNETPGEVWIVADGYRFHRATLVSEGAGQRTWTVSYNPSLYVRHQVQVSANHAYVLDHYVVSQNFDVNLAAPYVPYVPAAVASINRVNASPATVNTGDRTTITVVTNRDTEFVWAEVDDRRVNARRGNRSATTQSWTMEVSPARTQTVIVYANTENISQGAVTDSVRITVQEARPRIYNARLDRTQIERDQWTTIDIRTNVEVEHVWAIVDGRRENARRGSIVSGERTWVLDIRPEYTQTITVFANITNTDRDAYTTTVRVNVLQ
jgi:hypothetical protein